MLSVFGSNARLVLRAFYLEPAETLGQSWQRAKATGRRQQAAATREGRLMMCPWCCSRQFSSSESEALSHEDHIDKLCVVHFAQEAAQKQQEEAERQRKRQEEDIWKKKDRKTISRQRVIIRINYFCWLKDRVMRGCWKMLKARGLRGRCRMQNLAANHLQETKQTTCKSFQEWFSEFEYS